MIDEQTQRALVYLAKQVRNATCRSHGRARQWDEGGIAAKVAAVANLHLADVASAVIRAADDPTLDTPGAIANPSAPCWQERKTDRPRPIPADRGHHTHELCSVCLQPEGHRLHPDDHEYRRNTHGEPTAGAELARQALRTVRGTTTQEVDA